MLLDTRTGFSNQSASGDGKKAIPLSRWYERFAHVGLNYGPTFQNLYDLKARDETNLAEAKIKPPLPRMSGESRYIVHPATLDAALQLSIIASHSCVINSMKRRYLPVEFKSITVLPLNRGPPNDAILAFAEGKHCGIRGLSSNLVLRTASGAPVVNIRNMLLLASERSHAIASQGQNPYARILWKPNFDLLTGATVATLYPPVVADDSAILPSLETLALHQLIQFYMASPDLFKAGSQIPHLSRFLAWTTQKLELALNDQFPSGKTILNYSVSEREEKIQTLSSSLKKVSSEARLMCHLYQHLPYIFRGERTGLEVAIENNLLYDMYESSELLGEGNRRLAGIVDLLCHENPSLRILEIGAGTGSATQTILPVLKGETEYRRYKEYAFTDITTSFLGKAEKKLAKFRGVTYSTFDMEKLDVVQGSKAKYDLIIASNVGHYP